MVAIVCRWTKLSDLSGGLLFSFPEKGTPILRNAQLQAGAKPSPGGSIHFSTPWVRECYLHTGWVAGMGNGGMGKGWEGGDGEEGGVVGFP